MSRAVAALIQRPLEVGDREPVEAMTRASTLFRAEEVTVALDVFDAATGNGRRRDPDYQTLGAVAEGALVGWICWGPTPCTVGTYDLYWIVVERSWQGRGVGSALVAEMERQVEEKGRLIVVETAGRDDYAPTRAFYAARGYQVAASIADYYAPGDDLVTFVKRLREEQP
ncbi:MAG TPA: GNAT family N-acetyltransferase [Gemmatimonadales bacterium]|nr:GNAT family N-acetyltransferase [Gemmatimonadales bacterium]